MNRNNVVFRKKEPVRKQALGIAEVKDANKMKFLIPDTGVACRVVFKPAT